MTLTIFRGLPGSGKSTRAREMQREHGGRVVERDEIRYMLFGRYVDCDEKLVTEVQTTLIEQGLRMQENVYVSDMNLRNQYVTRLYDLARKHDAKVEVHDMTYVELTTCLRRNEDPQRRLRGRMVPEDTIRDLHQRFINKKGYPLPVTFNDAKVERKTREVYTSNPSLPDAIIVDIDGTLAKMVDRGPFDEHLVKNDELFENVARMVEHAALSGCVLVFMSGRTDGCYDDTEKWLLEKLPWLHGLGRDWELHMRRSVEDRGRPDDDVKYDLFMKHVAQRFNVLYAIDDRNKVVEMWRQIGLTCAQIAIGDF